MDLKILFIFKGNIYKFKILFIFNGCIYIVQIYKYYFYLRGVYIDFKKYYIIIKRKIYVLYFLKKFF